jgi:serine/threonine protein kinase
MASIQPLECPKCSRYFPHGGGFCEKDGTALQLVKLDGYILEEKIGEGGMGEVWKAKHPEIGKFAAIKVLGHHVAKNKDATRRFLQEARSVNAVHHRNLVDIFAFGQTSDGQPYMIMELLRGKTLSSYLKEKRVLSIKEIVALLGPVCSALHKTHEAGLIHRDLKPDNLFVVLEDDAEPMLKILDFGLVKFTQEEDDQGGMTQSMSIFGTPEYMSPEQCQKSKDVDRRTDIYALGVILSSMLAGRTPFREKEDSATMILVKQITVLPTPPSALVRGRKISPELDAVVLQALAKDRNLRYPTMIAFYDDLKKATAPYLTQTEDLSAVKPIYSIDALPPTANTMQPGTMSLNPSMVKSGYYAGATPPQPLSPPNKEKPKLLLVAAGFVLVGALAAGGYALLQSFGEKAVLVENTAAPLAIITPSSEPSSSPITPTPSSIEVTQEPPETTPEVKVIPAVKTGKTDNKKNTDKKNTDKKKNETRPEPEIKPVPPKNKDKDFVP